VFSGRGVEVANLGCGMRQIHTVSEWVDVNDMVATTELLVETVAAAHRGRPRTSPIERAGAERIHIVGASAAGRPRSPRRSRPGTATVTSTPTISTGCLPIRRIREASA